jgi:5-(carboxyamino)imidazole ribonucleotide mutase
MDAGPLNGHDALLSTVQMPGGIPVACVAIGKAGAKNAAYLSAQILAISDAELAERLKTEREANAQLVRDKDQKLQTNLDKQNVLSAPD